MAPQQSISELTPGKQVRDAIYLLVEKQLRVAKNGSQFLAARLRDVSGEIEARFWDVPSNVVDVLEEGQGVCVSGEGTSFKGQPQLRLDSIVPHAIRARDFFPSSSQPLPQMQARLEEYVHSVSDHWLHALLERVLLEPVFLSRFVEAPAARKYHHAWLGGLIEHTLGVADLAEAVASFYPDLSRDLIVTLALLHDVGKVEAYEWEAAFRRSDEGRLLDHIYLGTRRVEGAMEALPDFPSELRARVLHALLAHHGRLEAGSPTLPQTLEAVVLHLLDMLDSHIRGFLDHIEQHTTPGEVWSEYSRMFNVQLYRGSNEPPPAPPPKPRQQALPWDDTSEGGGDLPF